MQTRGISLLIGMALLVSANMSGPAGEAKAQTEKTAYSAMAALDQYLMPRDSEIALDGKLVS